MGQIDYEREQAGIGRVGNQEAVLEFVRKRNRVLLQTLIGHFVESPETGQMSISTLKSHLSKLSKRGELAKLKDGKKSVYCVPGWSPPEKAPVSEADRFLLDECKKVVSEIIASGLIWPETRLEDLPVNPSRIGDSLDTVTNPDEWIDRRIEKRFELSQKAYSLWYAIDEHQEYREYKIPTAWRWMDQKNWEEEKYSELGEWVQGCLTLDGCIFLMHWVGYLTRVIDFLSGEIARSEGAKRSIKTVGKKSALRA
jgi:hypothetical protein